MVSDISLQRRFFLGVGGGPRVSKISLYGGLTTELDGRRAEETRGANLYRRSNKNENMARQNHTINK